MYNRSVLHAVKDSLVNSALSSIVKPNEIYISDDGSPIHPSIGQLFVLVHPVERLNTSQYNNLFYEDQLMFGVTVGRHGRDIPKDRLPEYLYGESTSTISIEMIRDIVILVILNSSNNIYSNIYSSIGNSISTLVQEIQDMLLTNYQLVDSIKYLSTDASPVLRYPDYFGSSQKIEDEPRPAGITFTTVFSAPKLIVKTGCTTT